MKTREFLPSTRCWSVAILAPCLAVGCGSGASGGHTDVPPAPTVTTIVDAGVPPVPANGGKSACVISADCAAGQHCDLAECVQDCSSVDPCTGDLTCSPRGRCLPANTPDSDPPPTTQRQAQISVDVPVVSLTENDTSVAVALRSTTMDQVRYRVQITAPHLIVANPRGSFTGGKTTLQFPVTTEGLTGRDVPGNIKIFTTLGDVVVDAPMHVGATGSYQGALRYDGGPVPLGDARIALDVIETNGNVSARLDPAKSLLFPSTAAGETGGLGTYTASSGLDIVLTQLLDTQFGGLRNHFQRPIGRRLHIQAKPDSAGAFEGTFEEQIYGLFTQPVATSGHVHLAYEAHDKDPSFSVSSSPSMPAIANAPWQTVGQVFGWTTTDCNVVACDGHTACSDPVTYAEHSYYDVLQNAMSAGRTSKPFFALAQSCSTTLGLTSLAGYDAGSSDCFPVPPVACAMQVAATVASGDSSRAFGRMLGETVAPALLVAKNEIVGALNDSFANGFDAESAHYDRALAALGPSATWVVQPAALEFLRALSGSDAKGDPPTDTSTQNQTYPSARALADLFYTTSVIDGEQARIRASANPSDVLALAATAQQSAVLSFLESQTLMQVLSDWGTVPPTVGATMTGVLSPLDQGFAALIQGANAFGVTDGFVPFVYRAEDVGKGGPTNFEQALALAAAAISEEDNSEQAFKSNARQYELDEAQLNQELSNIRAQFDLKLKDICGASFDPNTVTSADDWNHCGDGGQGQVGDLANQLQEAQSRLQSSQARIQGMKDKISIDQNTLAATQMVHADNVQFIDNTGKRVAALTIAEGVITAAQKFAETAAQSSITNFGAPVAAAAVVAVLEVEKAGLDAQKEQLQTAQQMHLEESNAKIEYINGMANIQKETIDLAQLGVDMQNDIIALTGAQLRVQNLIAQARANFDERGRALALVGQDPANDPHFRILRDKQALALLDERAVAQRSLYLAGRALEYEINTPIASIGSSVLKASNSHDLSTRRGCLLQIFNDWRGNFGNPQDYVTTVSVRKMLGILGPRVDAVTGEMLTEGAQFRQLLLRNQNLDGRGGVGLEFATNLQPGNGLWSTDVCADRIASVQAQLVGDFLGDNQAGIRIAVAGDGAIRACGEDTLVPWSFGGSNSLAADAVATVQAGVNTFGDASANTSLFGQPVARASWRLVVPGPSDEPANADVDLTHIEDIVLRIAHKALPQTTNAPNVNLSCLGG